MPRLLVAVMSCFRMDYRDPKDPDVRDWWESTRCKDPAARREACRSTWLQGFKKLCIDYKFFLGRQTVEIGGKLKPSPNPRQPLEDEVFVDTGDLYHDNTHKFSALCKWALEHGYDYILRLDDDTFVYPERILATEWAEYDYSGAWNDSVVFFHPGGALFLSKKAMEIVVNTRVDHWADDAWLGKVMRNNHIPTHEIVSIHLPFGQEYVCNPDKLAKDHPWSAVHSCTPTVMKTLWERT